MSDSVPEAPKSEASQPRALERAAENSISSRALLGNQKLLLIDHRGEIYQLRETRNGKLLLNK